MIAGKSVALVAVPDAQTDDSSCAWQSPVSIHTVVPTSLPQSFLPSLPDPGMMPEQSVSQAQGMNAAGAAQLLLAACMVHIRSVRNKST